MTIAAAAAAAAVAMSACPLNAVKNEIRYAFHDDCARRARAVAAVATATLDIFIQTSIKKKLLQWFICGLFPF
jgi:hypothetical protein